MMPTNESKADDNQGEAPPHHITSASRRRLLHLLGAGAAAGLAGCSGEPGQSTDTATATGTGTETDTETGTETNTETSTGEELQKSATIGIPRNVTESWQTMYGVTPYWARVLEPLTWPTPELEAVPWLAKDWKRTGEKTWEFYLREGVTFHNGDRLNADAVIFSLKRFLTNNSFPEFAQSFMKLKPDGLRKIDDLTVEINNTSPFPRLPEQLTHLFTVIQHPDSSKGQKWGGVIGTGPYKEEELKPDDRLTVSAYDEYWRESKPQMEELTFRFIKDPNTRALALTGGQLDVGIDLSPSQLNSLNNAEDSKAVTQASARTGVFLFNNTRSPIDDIKLRKALNYAVSQEEIVEGALNGVGVPARGLIPSTIWLSAHDSLPTYGPDKEKAKQLVEESDYNGETLKVISETKTTFVQNPKLTAQLFQQQAKEVGVDVELQMLDDAGYDEAEKKGSGDIYQEGLFTSHAMPAGMFETDLYTTHGQYKFDEATEQRWVSLREKAQTAGEREVRKNAAQELEHLLVEEEAIIIPLYYQKYVIGTRAKVGEFDWHTLKLYNRMEKYKQMK